MMFVCEECHEARQERKDLESQPLQYTGYSYEARRSCECGKYRVKDTWYAYQSAYELLLDLNEMKEKTEKYVLPESFGVQGYYSAQDMLERSRVFPDILNDPETMQLVLEYAAELESS